jgi:hypothetical protein
MTMSNEIAQKAEANLSYSDYWLNIIVSSILGCLTARAALSASHGRKAFSPTHHAKPQSHERIRDLQGLYAPIDEYRTLPDRHDENMSLLVAEQISISPGIANLPRMTAPVRPALVCTWTLEQPTGRLICAWSELALGNYDSPRWL